MARYCFTGFAAVAALAISMLGFPGYADEAAREWTDATGKHRTEAAYVSSDGKVVTLLRQD